MYSRYWAECRRQIITGLILLLLGTGVSHATVLFSSNAESGTCNTGVATNLWDSAQSGNFPNSQMFYRCDTPVPNSGRSKYFRIDAINLQHDSWNIHNVSQINLTPGVTYYHGLFVRFDRILGIDIWHDGNGLPDSSDKLYEFNGSVRALIAAGFQDWANCSNLQCDHHFTFGLYLSPSHCTDCIYEQIPPNVSPYGRNNFIMADYGKWYAVVLGYTPSTGSTQNGKIELYVNGIKTHSYSGIKTQDSSSPYINTFQHSGTTAQPAYDAPTHYRKFDNFIFSNSLVDMQNAGLMSDPEAGNGAPNPPSNLRVQ